MVMADRISPFVTEVFKHSDQYEGMDVAQRSALALRLEKISGGHIFPRRCRSSGEDGIFHSERSSENMYSIRYRLQRSC